MIHMLLLHLYEMVLTVFTDFSSNGVMFLSVTMLLIMLLCAHMYARACDLGSRDTHQKIRPRL